MVFVRFETGGRSFFFSFLTGPEERAFDARR